MIDDFGFGSYGQLLAHEKTFFHQSALLGQDLRSLGRELVNGARDGLDAILKLFGFKL
jgi:hypothetical protein